MPKYLSIGMLALFSCFLVLSAFTAVPAKQLSQEDFVFVRGGCFQMGDVFGVGVDLEHPVHKVCLSDFYIGKYEVTQELWQQVMEENPSHNTTNPRYPVDVVSWYNIEEFLQKLNTQTGRKYRLPTEAEWEFACRAGGKMIQHGTKDGTLSDDMVIHSRDDESYSGIRPVGSFPPNELGIYDMSGSVSEWVMDWYDRKFYAQSPVDNPVVLSTRMETLKVRRGGYWGDQPWMLRCTFRNYRRPAHRLIGLGFRLAIDP